VNNSQLRPEYDLLLKRLKQGFSDSLKLLHLDQEVVSFSVAAINSVMSTPGLKHADKEKLNRQSRVLENLKVTGSLKLTFNVLYNQLLVTAVSYFESAAHDLLRIAVRDALKFGFFADNKQVPKLRVVDLWKLREVEPEDFSEFILSAFDVKFQNTRSITATFEEFLGLPPPTGKTRATLNDVIFSLECRHVLVHKAGRTDQKFINSTKDAEPRTLVQRYEINEAIQFQPDQLKAAMEAMEEFLTYYAKTVQERIDRPDLPEKN
jgi:hypothetical protein